MSLTTKEFRDRSLAPRWRVVALIVAGVGVVVGTVVLTGPQGDGRTEQAATGAPTSSASGATTTPPTSGKGSLVPQAPVNRPPTDPNWLTAAPTGLSWQRVDGVPLPFTASDGPSRIDGAVAAGYSHTPQGAAIAALQISMRMLYSPDYQQILDAQTAIPDEERAKIIAARSTQPRLDPAMVQRSTLQPAGFKVGAYDDASATIYYAYGRPNGQFRIARMAVVWREGDWKYSDELDAAAPQLPDAPDLNGFTPL